MPYYVKISHIAKGSNQELIKCISYIGKYYYRNTGDYYKDGVAYLKRKVKGATKRSIKLMVGHRAIKNNPDMCQWCFKYRVYRRIYMYILQCLNNKKYGDEREAKELLHSLVIELRNNNTSVKKEISDILAYNEKEVLEWAIDKEPYVIFQKEIDAILKVYAACDNKYSQCL